MLIENTYSKGFEKHFYKTILYNMKHIKTKLNQHIMHQSQKMDSPILFFIIKKDSKKNTNVLKSLH